MNPILVLAAETAEHAGNGFFLGDVKEVLISGVASVLVFGLLYWKGWPAGNAALQGRTERIAKELADA